MTKTWLNETFFHNDLCTPFHIEMDNEYLDDLNGRYTLLLKQAKHAGADEKSIAIIHKFKTKIIEALKCYYRADIGKSNGIVRNLLRDIGENPLAVSTLNTCKAFPGDPGKELQLFRGRIGDPSHSFSAKDMLHFPFSLRAKSGNYRFSIPGNPSLYLANSSYGCWIETGFPADHIFNVAPVLLDGTQKVLNLAVSIRDIEDLKDAENEKIHVWLKLFMLTIATSYMISEEDRTFKSEYIISQSIMMASKKLGYDGVVYYSKRVSSDLFAKCAINLAMFVEYEDEYSEIVKHMKIDNAFNYAVYKNLGNNVKEAKVSLRTAEPSRHYKIGSYDRQYLYSETIFCEFDHFLFATWENKPKGKGKNDIPWGIGLNENKMKKRSGS